jgi:hypothetical protein
MEYVSPDGSLNPRDEIAYWKRNAEHLRVKKHELEGHLEVARTQQSNVESQVEHWKRAYRELEANQAQALDGRRQDMDAESMQDMLSGMRMARNMLYEENLSLQKRLAEAQIDQLAMDQPRSGSTCVVCMDNLADVVLWPCRHLALCKECGDSAAANMTVCPCCRANIENRTQIFTP